MPHNQNQIFIFHKNNRNEIFIKLIIFKLNILKIILFPRIRSAKDYDRLRFEFELCRVASNKKGLYVGIHERSFVSVSISICIL